MFRRSPWLTVVLLIAAGAAAGAADDLAYLQRNNPWSPHTRFPKLTTPQWVGEDGVEAVVVLAIDDMRDPARYEAYLRPILQRLKKIDGRAPVSIMTCQVKPDDQQLQSWLAEGLSIEVHTIDHPCPLLNSGDFAKAKSTYDRCVDLLSSIPGNRPVAFRMPCCDSLNTVSPRFYSEIFNRKTASGHFLSISSSVFNLYTPEDATIPRPLILDKQGRPRFQKYIPHQNSAPPHFRFNNFIENYPYPYTINNTCWEFPCVVPSDWEAQNLHKPNNPVTVEDMQAALDITVHKQGVYCLVFHPHGWIRNDQVVQLINHAVSQHGKKVKFLTFPEALRRLNQHLLDNEPLRDASGRDNGVRLIDVNQDGLLDVTIGNQHKQQTRVWQPETRRFLTTPFPARWVLAEPRQSSKSNAAARRNGPHALSLPGPRGLRLVSEIPSTNRRTNETAAAWVGHRFHKGAWQADQALSDLLRVHAAKRQPDSDAGMTSLHFHTLTELNTTVALVTRGNQTDSAQTTDVFGWSVQQPEWKRLPTRIPSEIARGLAEPGRPRVRFVDLDEDGSDDLLLSPEPHAKQSAPVLQIWLMDWLNSRKPVRVALKPAVHTMPIVRSDGSDNGFFVRDRHLCWQNEDTNQHPDLLHRVSFDEVLQLHSETQARQGQFPAPRTPRKSAELIRVRPGLRVELVASEPLIRDPVAFDWDVTGRLWVVEMGGYPNGTDGKGTGGGRVRILTDVDNDGRFDTAQTFLDKLNFPTGLQRWRGGILVTAAPEIIYAEDTDGDGRADIRQTLYRGFVEGNQQHRVNGLRWGLDNWLYVANGDSGGNITCERALKTPHGPLPSGIAIGGRDFRIRPDEGLIDPQSGQTQFGRNRDDWGNWFGCNNSNPVWHYALADHYLRRNPHFVVKTTREQVSVTPGAAPVFPMSRTLPRYNDFQNVNRFTSACSTMIYRDVLLGDAFYGNVLTSEPVHNLISRLVLHRDGIKFTGRRAADETQAEFLASRDNWFRPTMIRTGPDGALWIADMYRAVIEHPKWIPADWQARLDLRSGQNLGRIYRVVPETVADPCQALPASVPPHRSQTHARPLRCFFEHFRVATPALVRRLASPNGWWRDTAQRLLVHRQDLSAIPALQAMVQSDKSPLARLHALCVLDGLHALSGPVLIRALRDAHPAVRRHALRLSGANPNWTKQPEVTRAVLERVTDEDLLVQQQLAYTAGDLHGQHAGPILATLLKRHTTNPWLTAAAMSSLNPQNIRDVLGGTISTITADTNQTKLLARLMGQAAAFKQLDAIKKPLMDLLPEPGQKISPARWASLTTVAAEFQKHPTLWKTIVTGEQARLRWSAAVSQALQLVADPKVDVGQRVAALRFSSLGGIEGQLSVKLLT
ncbi:MAG: PVC-type heme-binding CxxCH protein, partial [Planctomycetaceae bacterium]